MLDTAPLFGHEEYSDLTVKFSGREMRCHKVILCTKSDYFKKLCGAGSKFQESRQNSVELHEDDPDAVEAVLLHIYGGDLIRTEDWLHMLHVSKAAKKYLLPDLEKSALDHFTKRFREQLARDDKSSAVDAILTVRELGDGEHNELIRGELIKNHKALIQEPEYLKLLRRIRNSCGDTCSIWKDESLALRESSPTS